MHGIADKDSTAVERTLAILEAVAHRPAGLTNADISRKLDIPKSSASYILRTLERHGYLRRDLDTGKYRLGVKVLSLGQGALTGVDVRQVGLPHLRQLVEHSQLTAHLAILDGDEAVYIEKVDAPGFIKMDTWVGKRMEIYSTAVGKSVVAYLPEDKVERLLHSRGMKRRTPKTITSISRLLRDLQIVRERGYAVDDEENSLGVRCVAAPIFNGEGQVEASVGMSGTLSQMTPEMLPKMAELVKDAARRISQQLGHRPQPVRMPAAR